MDREEVIVIHTGYLVISTKHRMLRTPEYSILLLPVQIMLQFGRGGGIISLCPGGGVRTLST